MKLLICTQALDTNDSDLGFFVRWVAEFAKHCEKVTVLCLRKGTYALPGNVHVRTLGDKPTLLRAVRLVLFCISFRREYDAVFVHMNPEYAVVAGPLWRLMRKRISLWYTHKNVDLKLRIAAFWANVILTASLESFRLASPKVRVMGHGIDTDFFSPDPGCARRDWLLSVGRLMPSKRHDLAIRAAAKNGRELRIIGEGPERMHLEVLAKELGANVRFLGGLTQSQLRDEYRKAAFLIHTSETGSLDKVVLEALATDLAAITTSDVFREFPVHTVPATAEGIVEALTHTRESYDRVNIIGRDHSLEKLVREIVRIIRHP